MEIGSVSSRALRPIDPGFRTRREPPRPEPEKAARAKIIEAEFSPAPLPYPVPFLAHLLGQVMMANAAPQAGLYAQRAKPRLGLLADETA
jgi:hypothetical protein